MGDIRGVARELRLAREAAGLTREQLSEKVGLSVSLIEKVERGAVRASDTYLTAVSRALAPAAGILSRMGQDERLAIPVVPDWFRPWQDHEQEASEIRCYELALIPGLLQTEGYAMALLGDPERVTARMERQGVLDRATLTAIIDEAALHRGIGDPMVMVEQLHSLATATRATVHVLPADAGTHAGTLGGFVLGVVDGEWCGYLDTPARGLLLTEDGVISELRQRWDSLATEALPRTLSQRRIMEAAERWKQQMT